MNKKELRQLSKNQLIDLFFAEREARLILEKRLGEVERSLRAFDNPHTPRGKVRSKKNTERDESNPRFPGKPAGGNGGGVKMPPPDKEDFVGMDCCDCGAKLGDPYDTYSFCQMDVPEPEFVTTKYVVGLYKCSCCGDLVDAGEDMSKGFYGPHVTALVGCLRNEGLSLEAGARFLRDVYKLQISNVAVYNKLVHLTMAMHPEREHIRRQITRALYVHMDETGFRRDGQNGHAWTACTPNHCLFEYDHSRGAIVAQRILKGFNGSIITDDYKGYHWYPEHQLCWSHLLRESKEFSKKYDGATRQHKRLKTLYDKAKRAQKTNDPSQYDKLEWELEDIATCYHPLDGCKTMHAKLHNRTKLWLHGVKNTHVPLNNNHAERCIRKIVLHRNRIGCIRNEKGKDLINTFFTCTTTWKLQNKNIYQQLLNHAS